MTTATVILQVSRREQEQEGDPAPAPAASNLFASYWRARTQRNTATKVCLLPRGGATCCRLLLPVSARRSGQKCVAGFSDPLLLFIRPTQK